MAAQHTITALAKDPCEDWETVFTMADAALCLRLYNLARKLFLSISDQMPKDHVNRDFLISTLTELGEGKKARALQTA